MTVPYRNSNGLDAARPVSMLVPSLPFKDEGDLVTKVWRQTHEVIAENYAPLTFTSAHPTLSPSAYYVGDERFFNKQGGILVFDRVWANIPPQRLVPSSYTYNFIGIVASPFEGISRRQRFTRTVDSEVTFDYYLPGVTGGIDTIDDIPSVSAQRYFRSVEEWRDVNFLNFNTTPSRNAYLAMRANEDRIVVEDSQRSPWMGNIIERRVERVKAQ